MKGYNEFIRSLDDEKSVKEKTEEKQTKSKTKCIKFDTAESDNHDCKCKHECKNCGESNFSGF